MFELTGIRQRYGERTVLAVDDLALERGARVAVVGPNGAAPRRGARRGVG
jgi:ATPase subunit of ABC transporter with duplicated ATPase domains